MKISEIYRLEESNQEYCYLLKDGIFWRAWEKSAKLFHEFIKPYEITMKQFKALNKEMVYLGFPDKILNNIIEIFTTKGFKVVKYDHMLKITGFRQVVGFKEWKLGYREHHIALSVDDSRLSGICNSAFSTCPIPFARRM